jgi:hypothetical protein
VSNVEVEGAYRGSRALILDTKDGLVGRNEWLQHAALVIVVAFLVHGEVIVGDKLGHLVQVCERDRKSKQGGRRREEYRS